MGGVQGDDVRGFDAEVLRYIRQVAEGNDPRRRSVRLAVRLTAVWKRPDDGEYAVCLVTDVSRYGMGVEFPGDAPGVVKGSVLRFRIFLADRMRNVEFLAEVRWIFRAEGRRGWPSWRCLLRTVWPCSATLGTACSGGGSRGWSGGLRLSPWRLPWSSRRPMPDGPREPKRVWRSPRLSGSVSRSGWRIWAWNSRTSAGPSSPTAASSIRRGRPWGCRPVF